MRIISISMAITCCIVIGRADPWPISSFYVQHQINGTIYECRSDSVNGDYIGRHHWHTGVDIPAPDSTAVYPTNDAEIEGVYHNYVLTVSTQDYYGYTYYYTKYYHLKNTDQNGLENGDEVERSITWLGNTDSYNHLHLEYFYYNSYTQKNYYENPLAYLSPFNDDQKPVFDLTNFWIDGIGIFRDISDEDDPITFNLGSSIQQGDKIDIFVHVHDEIDVYGGNNLGIARMECSIKDPLNNLVFNRGFDFFTWDLAFSELPKLKLRYAPGSNTNEFIYNVTNKDTSNGFWDTSGLSEGNYTITITAYDYQDNEDGVQNSQPKSKSVYISASPSQNKIGRNQK